MRFGVLDSSLQIEKVIFGPAIENSTRVTASWLQKSHKLSKFTQIFI